MLLLSTRVPIYHKSKKHIAFYYDDVPIAGDIVKASKAQALDGTLFTSGVPIICGTCGDTIMKSWDGVPDLSY